VIGKMIHQKANAKANAYVYLSLSNVILKKIEQAA
jgi:hypothetical protein